MSDNEASLGSQPILLQSKDHGELLDVIDILRSQGISRYISLPQLIVCGDQSSGKSSVLEAVSGVRFPTKDNLCTRFPTELILRRDREESAKVTIVPGAERTEGEKSKLHSFATSITSTDELPALIDKAKETMGLGTDSKAFSDDVLRVEISGPRQPHLTLVDLPGLIHAENKQQSAADVELVKVLVKSYVANTRSIILAVVSAKNDYANQIVTKLAREVDPKGLRTLGIITKPDTLHVGSDNEKAFLDLARNEDVYFRLGWHVLMNRDYVNKDCSVEERDQTERQFLSQGVWTSLPISSLGVGTLKPRLSAVLRDQIISELPKLIKDLEAGIRDCRNRLANLGDARTTEAEQRLYLVRVSQAFTSLVKGAVDGSYVHEFFGEPPEDYSKRLRAVVTNILLDFSELMRKEGHEREIVNDLEQPKSARKILRSEYIKHVKEIMKKNRGRELPGTFNPLIIGVLFYEQSRPWEGLVNECCENILSATKVCVELFINHVADKNTKDGLLREIIDPAMVTLRESLKKKIAEIMRPHQTGHPITYNHYFTETIQKARQEHNRKDQVKRLNKFFGVPLSDKNQLISQPNPFYTAQLLDSLTQQTQQEMDQYACSEATECMQAYYKVRLLESIAIYSTDILKIGRYEGPCRQCRCSWDRALHSSYTTQYLLP